MNHYDVLDLSECRSEDGSEQFLGKEKDIAKMDIRNEGKDD